MNDSDSDVDNDPLDAIPEAAAGQSGKAKRPRNPDPHIARACRRSRKKFRTDAVGAMKHDKDTDHWSGAPLKQRSVSNLKVG